MLGGRQAVTILTKASWWCGGIFLVLALLLSFVRRGGDTSDLQERLRASTPTPAPSAQVPLGGTPLPAATPTKAPATAAAPTKAKPSAKAPAKTPAPGAAPPKPKQ